MNEIEILDRLINVCIDSQKRYEHAAGDVGRLDLEKFFRRQAAERASAAKELEALRALLDYLFSKLGKHFQLRISGQLFQCCWVS